MTDLGRLAAAAQAPDLVLADVLAILDALGLGTHARPYSAHEVVHRDILPAIRRLTEDELTTGLDHHVGAKVYLGQHEPRRRG